MKDYPYRGEAIAQTIAHEIEETTGFVACLKLAVKYEGKVFPSCDRLIIKRLFELCFEGRIINHSFAKIYRIHTRDTDVGRRYFCSVFSDFNSLEAQSSYENMNDKEKEAFILNETKRYWSSINSYYIAKETYLLTVDLFPELKEMMIDKLFSLCFDKKGLVASFASDYVETMGKHESHSKWLLNKYRSECAEKLVMYSIAFIILVVIVFSGSLPGIGYLFFGILAMGTGSYTVQYLIKTVDAIKNYRRTRGFIFNTGVLTYQGFGRYREFNDSPITKPEDK